MWMSAKRGADSAPFAFPEACPDADRDALREPEDSVRRLLRRSDLSVAKLWKKLKHFVWPRCFGHRSALGGQNRSSQFYKDGWIAEAA